MRQTIRKSGLMRQPCDLSLTRSTQLVMGAYHLITVKIKRNKRNRSLGIHDILESINNKIQLAKRRARGYRNINNFINMIYFLYGKLRFTLPTVFHIEPNQHYSESYVSNGVTNYHYAGITYKYHSISNSSTAGRTIIFNGVNLDYNGEYADISHTQYVNKEKGD
ncbi:Transposase [Nitrosomonas communis]|uniref:Transposase n=1 Tax=Nitrosomonas communis TaxID=44574 RepID=A0A1H2WAF0_9PROT|nr:Transposase [Nitrosomonas communis]